MPLTLVTPGKGGQTKDSLPSFFISEHPKKKLTQLKKFLSMVEQNALDYYGADPEAGSKYINAFKHNANIGFLEKTASDKVMALIQLAKEEGLTNQQIVKIALDSLDLEPNLGKHSLSDNILISAPVVEEEVDLHDFRGFVNKELANDLYVKLTEGLDEEHIEEAHKSVDSHIEDETMFLDMEGDYWNGVVNEDKFKDNILEQIKLEEDVAEERIPATAAIYKDPEWILLSDYPVNTYQVHMKAIEHEEDQLGRALLPTSFSLAQFGKFISEEGKKVSLDGYVYQYSMKRNPRNVHYAYRIFMDDDLAAKNSGLGS